MLFKNGYILNENFKLISANVKISNGKIAQIGNNISDENEEIYDLNGNYLIPGLIDEHFHGCNGHAVLDCDKQSFLSISEFEATNGITAIVPTLSSYPDSTVLSCISAAKSAMGSESGARIEGLHLEGPFLSQKYRGAHNPGYLKLPTVQRLKSYLTAGDGIIKLITIAPELENAVEVIKYAVKSGVTVEIGHSDATLKEAVAAIDAGATVATHTFNAMVPLNHRNPGILGAVLTDDRVHCEVIGDFGHVAPQIVKLIYKAKGEDLVNFVSDSTAAAGLADGVYENEEHLCTVKNGISYFEDGTINGSASTVLRSVKNAVSIGIPLASAIKMASLNPAVSLGISQKTGSIKTGKLADLAVVTEELNIVATFVGGKKVFG